MDSRSTFFLAVDVLFSILLCHLRAKVSLGTTFTPTSYDNTQEFSLLLEMLCIGEQQLVSGSVIASITVQQYTLNGDDSS